MKANGNGYRKARGAQEERKSEGEGRNGGGRLYNWGPKAGDRPRTEKEAQVGQARLAEISFALILYGRFVSSAPLH
jgi:hypothetical protein